MTKRSLLIPGILAFLVVSSVPALAGGPKTLDEALALAAQENKPILVDFYATWCGPCKAFDKDLKNDAAIQAATGEFILFKTDAETEGKELAGSHNVVGYPTYVVLNPKGAVLSSWSGYTKELFLESTGSVLADLTTIEEKYARYEKNPTAVDAALLAGYHDSRGEYADAMKYYHAAVELNTDPSVDYAMEIMEATYYGMREGLFNLGDLTAGAEAVFESKNSEESSLFTSARMVLRAGRSEDKPETAAPYLKGAYERTEASKDEAIQKSRANIYPSYLLYVEGDSKKAVEARKALLPESWMDSPEELNSFSWWCFENKVNLEKAYDLAKRGVDISEPGKDRSEILDTLAEICNAMDDCRQALKWIQLAIQDNPDREYFKKQEKRFQELLAAKEEGQK